MAEIKESWVNCIIVAVLIFFLGGAIMQPYFEAKTFNKLTGGKATYWDAVFAELRVDGSSQVIRSTDNQKTSD